MNDRFENVLKEDEMCEFLGVDLDQLHYLRNYHELPFVKVSPVRRYYFESDILNWLKNKRTVAKWEFYNDDRGWGEKVWRKLKN